MDIRAYIESGILELFALGLLSEPDSAEVERLLVLHEELGAELERIYMALEDYAKEHAVEPPAGLVDELMERIENQQLEEAMDPLHLPLITVHTDYRKWRDFALPMVPALTKRDGRAVKVLTHHEGLTQLLLCSETDFDWEVHEDEHESFLILSGQAICLVGNSTRLMSQGDFMKIPLHVLHAVKLLSPSVTAILQRRKARA
ncbi:MAG: hypothetical protein REI78_02875 [Pedobacter sp.]|nr:hypothetical protein [Pedobacter sp.]